MTCKVIKLILSDSTHEQGVIEYQLQAAYSAKQNGEVSDIWRALLIKYASNGELLSQSTFGPSDNETDWAGKALALAKNGDVVLGIDNGSFGFLRLRATK